MTGNDDLIRRGAGADTRANPDDNPPHQIVEEEKEPPQVIQPEHLAQQRQDREMAKIFENLEIPSEHLGRSATIHSGLKEVSGSRQNQHKK